MAETKQDLMKIVAGKTKLRRKQDEKTFHMKRKKDQWGILRVVLV